MVCHADPIRVGYFTRSLRVVNEVLRTCISKKVTDVHNLEIKVYVHAVGFKLSTCELRSDPFSTQLPPLDNV